jgi:hypothetical protein
MSVGRPCSAITNKLPAGTASQREGETGFASPPGCTHVPGLSVALTKLINTKCIKHRLLSIDEFGQDTGCPGTCVQPGGDANPLLSKALVHVNRTCQSLA